MPLSWFIVARMIHYMYTFYLNFFKLNKKDPFRGLIKYLESTHPELGDGKVTIF